MLRGRRFVRKRWTNVKAEKFILRKRRGAEMDDQGQREEIQAEKVVRRLLGKGLSWLREYCWQRNQVIRAEPAETEEEEEAQAAGEDGGHEEDD